MIKIRDIHFYFVSLEKTSVNVVFDFMLKNYIVLFPKFRFIFHFHFCFVSFLYIFIY